MSYQVLARKWRPQRFEDLVGQAHVQRALVNALKDDRLHHAYLFTGTRGVGKTTIARIFAKALNCETGITATPCGECTTCVEITEGRYVDLIEVDAASRTGVDDTRELLENVQYAPTRGRYKVYLIDEVHMFSRSSFNALLKTLEEPPPHVKFLLATTDPEKLPVTILSRCLQFNLKRLPVSMITAHLQHVLGEEDVEFNVTALQLIAEAADGSMRDALSLLDQALAFGAGTVQEQEVRDMLGTVSRDRVLGLLRALFSKDANGLMSTIAELDEFSPDYESILAELLSVLHHMSLARTVPEALDSYVSSRQQLVELSEQVSAEDLQLFYQIALIGRRDLPLSPDPRSGFEMLLLRMLAFRPGQIISLENISQKSVTTGNPATPQASSRPPAGSARQDAGESTRQPVAVSRQSVAAPDEVSADPAAAAKAAIRAAAGQTPKQPAAASTEPAARASKETADAVRDEQSSPPPVSAESAVTAAATPDMTAEKEADTGIVAGNAGIDDWASVVQSLPLGGQVKQLAMNCSFGHRDGNHVLLQIESGYTNLLSDKAKMRLQQALGEYFDIDASLEIEIVQQFTRASPAQLLQQQARERQAQAEQSIEGDSFTRALRENFDAELVPGSIKPAS